ncbi:hypothetical protein R1flu_023948 [Riccia fluitans]|uniref:3'(2'),5'-bisphosphate nucleotidase n=1 Tax=Riccia fluitans TaxID=41844 RepID=A0ABD1XWE5_9MARC
MAGSSVCVVMGDLPCFQGTSSLHLLRPQNLGVKGPRFASQRQSPSAIPARWFRSRRGLLISPSTVRFGRKTIPRRLLVLRSACDSPELAVVTSRVTAVYKEGSTQQENLLWMCGEEQGSAESRVREVSLQTNESNSGDTLTTVVETPEYATGYRSANSGIEGHDSFSESHSDGHTEPSLLGDVSPFSYKESCSSEYEKELEAAVRAVQLSCILSQTIQQRILRNEENTDFKKDRSIVTVADWGVQAVVSWVLSQAFSDEEIPMMAEEDTTGLRGMEKIDLLQRVVAAVNDCLQHAEKVGVSPPPRPLGAIDVLKAINKGSAEGGPKGRYWVLDPVDGTLGFVRGDQYAVALALIDDGEVVLAVLGCPNFPLRKQWLVHHHRYYRIASRLNPPSPNKWHKGLLLTTTKGAGEVIMRPLVLNADGSTQWKESQQMATPVSVSTIDDPVEATFCEPFEKANSSHSFTAGLAEHLGLRNRPLRVYSMAKYAAIARGDAEIFMKFAKTGYREKIWDHAAGVLIVQEAGGVVTDAGGNPLDFSQGRFLDNLDRGIIACSGNALHDKLLKAVDASWNSSKL